MGAKRPESSSYLQKANVTGEMNSEVQVDKAPNQPEIKIKTIRTCINYYVPGLRQELP